MAHEEHSTAVTNEPARSLPPRETCAEVLALGFAMTVVGFVIGGIGTAMYLGENAYLYGDVPLAVMVVAFLVLTSGLAALGMGLYRAGQILDRLDRTGPDD